MDYESYVFPQDEVEPDEYSVGQIIMSFDPSCDFIIAVGSGVINDIAKIIAKASSRDYLLIATAPSMDGFASNSSSMIQNGVKVTLYGMPCSYNRRYRHHERGTYADDSSGFRRYGS